MCLKKKKREMEIFKLSDEAVVFVKKYLLPECNVTTKIDGDVLDVFLDKAFEWESSMVGEDGEEKNGDYPEKERNEMADRFVTEVSGRWANGEGIPDFDDLNKRLGLL